MSVRNFRKFLKMTLTSSLLIGAIPAAMAATDPYDNYIVFSDTVPRDQRELLQSDILNLKKLTFSDDENQSGSRLFNTLLNPQNLQAWLYQRSHYVVPENFNLDETTISIIKPLANYPNPTMPEIERGTAVPDGTSAVKTIMSNIGAALYLGGKMQSSYFAVNIPGHGEVKINSPRAGIFKMGEGMFLPLLRKSGGTDYNTFANSMWRLAVFFHEARHSDGNGKSLGFIHAVCPAGHNYAGYNACDKNLNGPYTIGATFLKASTNNCTNCSEAEREALRNTYADSFGRVMAEFPAANSRADAVARSAQDTLRSTCEEMKKMGIDVSKYDFCKETTSSSVMADVNGNVKAEVLDEKPELLED